jgi:hydroxypyruvate reductase
MSDLKQLARDIFREALAGVDIPRTFARKLLREGSRVSIDDVTVDLAAYRSIRAVAMGKASAAMARGLVTTLGDDVQIQGVLAAPHDALAEIPGFRAIGAAHPVPDEGSFAAARAILDLIAGADERTLLFFLLSGGSSALVELPLDSRITLRDVQQLHRLLVNCGAPIDEMNAVRKHLSAVKGGRLAAAAPAAMKLSLGVTDVPQGRESALASGPTLPDPTTVADACRVIERYGLLPKLPAAIRAKFEHPETIPETPKAGDAAFSRAHFVMLLGMHDLFHHAHRAAEERGCVTICDNATDDWPIEKARDFLLAELARLRAARPGHRVAVIADGEVSSPVTGDGVGGRNSAFVLSCVEKIAGDNIAVLSAGTDGKDGSSPAAGAVADGKTLERARATGLDPRDFFRRCDSYNFFRALGDAIETGPTHNNLRDLRILIAE